MNQLNRVEAFRVRYPLEPPIGTTLFRIESVETVVVHLRTHQGDSGYGYAYMFDPDDARAIGSVVRKLAPVVVGEPVDPDTLTERMEPLIDFSGSAGLALYALSAINMALWDLSCKRSGISLSDKVEQILTDSSGAGTRTRDLLSLGGTPLHECEAGTVYGSDGFWLSRSGEELYDQARGYGARGVNWLKIRVSSDPWDRTRDRLRAVVEGHGAGRAGNDRAPVLLLDAFQSLNVQETLRLTQQLAGSSLPVAWLEDPLPKFSFDGYRRLDRSRVGLPLVSGESLSLSHSIRSLLDTDSLSILMLDLQRVGGINGWIRFSQWALEQGVWVTPHLYPHVGRSLVRGTPNALMVEHVPWWDSVFGALPLQNRTKPASEPGIGLHVSPEQLETQAERLVSQT